MSSIFLNVLNMSLTASYVALIVIIVRFFLKKAPKIFSYALWAVVLFRLLCPFTFESYMSFMPANMESISENIVFNEYHSVDAETKVIDSTANNSIQSPLLPANQNASPTQRDVIVEAGWVIWVVGITILLTYGLFSYFKLKRKLAVATLVNDNIFETDEIKTPFVLGMLKPRIFIPVNIPPDEIDYIIKHERTHIKRYDYIIKPISFIALSIHWFNPLIWLSYFLMSKDMEMSCDESVMKGAVQDVRVRYSNSLLSLSDKKKRLLVPLAFGESNVKQRIKNILNYKKPSFWIFLLVVVIVIIVWFALGTNPVFNEQIQFPLKTEDIEKVFSENEIDWTIADHNAVDNSRDIFSFKNNKNITLGIDAQVKDNFKVLNMTWFLPDNLTSDEVNDFFNNELPKHFKLTGVFYGNKKELDKALDEMLNYYLDEKNYNKSLYWNKRVGNDHLKVKIQPMLDGNKNQIITMMIMPHELYESYLISLSDTWAKAAELQNIKVLYSTVAQLKETAAENIPAENDMDIFSGHFEIYGSLENIKENKSAFETLKSINSSYLIPNKDKYLSAKLLDNTGSVDVFLEMTSLNKNELSLKRNHSIVMLYNNNKPIYVVRFSALYSEEERAQEVGKTFINDLYTVNSQEINNYEKFLNLKTSDAKALSEAMTINDNGIKSLMTERAYDTLIKNRENLKFTNDCYEGNYTMEVEEIKLSENKNSIVNNEAGYNFELQIKYISHGDTVTKGTAKGFIELNKVDDNWKVAGYRTK